MVAPARFANRPAVGAPRFERTQQIGCSAPPRRRPAAAPPRTSRLTACSTLALAAAAAPFSRAAARITAGRPAALAHLAAPLGISRAYARLPGNRSKGAMASAGPEPVGSTLDGQAPDAVDTANYFVTYAYIYHRERRCGGDGAI